VSKSVAERERVRGELRYRQVSGSVICRLQTYLKSIAVGTNGVRRRQACGNDGRAAKACGGVKSVQKSKRATRGERKCKRTAHYSAQAKSATDARSANAGIATRGTAPEVLAAAPPAPADAAAPEACAALLPADALGAGAAALVAPARPAPPLPPAVIAATIGVLFELGAFWYEAPSICATEMTCQPCCANLGKFALKAWTVPFRSSCSRTMRPGDLGPESHLSKLAAIAAWVVAPLFWSRV